MSKDTVVPLRQPEGQDLLSTMLREGAQRLIIEALQVEFEEFLSQFVGQRDEHERAAVVRNGFQARRELLTGLGAVSVRVPKARSRTAQSVVFRSTLVPRMCAGRSRSMQRCRGCICTGCRPATCARRLARWSVPRRRGCRRRWWHGSSAAGARNIRLGVAGRWLRSVGCTCGPTASTRGFAPTMKIVMAADTPIRGDLSNQLIHLTRGDARRAEERFRSIIEGGELRGSDGCIKGMYKCVCFSEAPISVIAQMVAGEQARYAPFGVMIPKLWLFEKGGRPVIYQPDDEFELLRAEQRYRHVRYEPPDVDWTWEREWRIRTETLQLELSAVTLIVPTREWSSHFLRPRTISTALPSGGWLAGDIASETAKWHFIALSDLGVQIDWPAPLA